MSSEFRYILGKVLDTQDPPTLRLASSHYVLHLNPIKDTLNIVFILTRPKNNPNFHLSWHITTQAYHTSIMFINQT